MSMMIKIVENEEHCAVVTSDGSEWNERLGNYPAAIHGGSNNLMPDLIRVVPTSHIHTPESHEMEWSETSYIDEQKDHILITVQRTARVPKELFDIRETNSTLPPISIIGFNE